MPKKSVDSGLSPKPRKPRINEALLQNMIELQKVHTNLLERFDKLSDQLSSLLNLFESAAKSFAENPLNNISEKDKDFLEKIDKLLDQNKTIAKGLTLMEDRLRQRIYGGPAQGMPSPNMIRDDSDEYQPSPVNKPLPKF